jgi:hypothetical protein
MDAIIACAADRVVPSELPPFCEDPTVDAFVRAVMSRVPRDMDETMISHDRWAVRWVFDDNGIAYPKMAFEISPPRGRAKWIVTFAIRDE